MDRVIIARPTQKVGIAPFAGVQASSMEWLKFAKNMYFGEHPNFNNILVVRGEGTARPALYLMPQSWEDAVVPAPFKIFGTPFNLDAPASPLYNTYFDFGQYYSNEGTFGYHSDSFCLNVKTNGGFNGQFPSVKFTWQDESGIDPRAGGIIYANTNWLNSTVRGFPGSAIAIGDYLTNSWNIYQATTAGTMGLNRPTHTVGSQSVDGITWAFVRNAQADWTAGAFRPFWIFGAREKLPALPAATLRAAKAIIDGDFLLGWGSSILGLNSTDNDLVGEIGFSGQGTVLLNAVGAGIRSSASGANNFIQPIGATFVHSNKVVTSGVTVDASNASLIRLNYSSAATVTSFTNLIQWQEFKIHTANTNVTLANNANITLKNGANRALVLNEVVTLLAISTTVVVEV